MPDETFRDLIFNLTEGPPESQERYGDGHRATCEAPEGVVVEIDEDTFDWFMDVLPPRYFAVGLFAFAEGEEPYRLFWRKQRRFFVRRLSWAQTREFARLARQEGWS